MSIRRGLRSYLLNVLLSPGFRRAARRLQEIRRRLLRRPHRVSVFLQLDDPYSYLLAHYLPALRDHYAIELRLYLSESRGGAYQPEPQMLAEYAMRDCERVARELGIPFLDKGRSPPFEQRRSMLDTIASCDDAETFQEELLQALQVFWRGDTEAASRRNAAAETRGRSDALVQQSQKLQLSLGHYNSATLHYAGEWYWGVDRLQYLLQRLDELSLARDAGHQPLLSSLRQAMQVSLPVAPPAAAKTLPDVELFHSIRSPYSYLALRRVSEIADAFGLALKIRPVLPMVMRGMQVPEAKLLYILNDAAREAARRGVPFGRIADPVGPGSERALAVFFYAEAQQRGTEFLLNAGEAIWARAIDVASDTGMRKVTDKTGLSWPAVKAAMTSREWRDTVAENRNSMLASGSWGVPTLRLGEFVAWGQDRDWLLLRHIEELCDKGDGILV
jgi:2-hydroxychromene-2-carboxylate isomerase